MAKRKGWHPADIKAAVAKRGVTLAELARRHGLHEAACAHALYQRHCQAEKVIAGFLGVPLHQIWPSRWYADGRRIDGRVLAKTSALPKGSERQNATVAQI